MVIEYEVSIVNECELVACTLNPKDQRVIICSIYIGHHHQIFLNYIALFRVTFALSDTNCR